MNLSKLVAYLVLASGLTCIGCDGGAGGVIASNGNGGGIGGTGVTSSGTIDGFGSIFVNGVEFETDESEVLLDGATSTADDLRLGMVVTVRGTVNADRKTGTANQVIFHNEIKGPVSAIEIDPDGESLLLTVLGVSVIAERTATVFDGVNFETLSLDDFVEVSGFFESSVQIRSTRIAKSSPFVPGVSEVKVEGNVTALSGTQFSLGTVVVDFSNADLSGIQGGRVSEGLLVEVYGTLSGNVITASRVEEDEDISHGFDDDDEVTILGAINNFVDLSHFTVSGVTVDASSASLEPGDLVLANGVIVEVEGRWNGTVLVAEEVMPRRGRVKLEARVTAVDTAGGRITMQYVTGTVTVAVNSTTLLKDDTGQQQSLSLRDIASGNFLQIEATQVGNSLLASRIQRDQADDYILRAPVQRFSSGVDITLLGVTFGTAGAKFKNGKSAAVGANAFFGQLKVGDLVKVSDKEVPDGIADEVELEQDGALDDDD